MRRLFCIAGLVSLLGGCGAVPAVRVQPLETPAAPGSGEPNLAVGADGRLYLSWIEPAGDAHALRFATWTGDAWSAPRTIATGEDWFVNWADFPSIAAAEDGTLAAHWLARSGESTYAYDVKLALSRDGGATWSDAFSPHDDGTRTEHGFVSMVPLADGGFGMLWLDGRETAVDARENPLGTGVMTLRSATVDRDGNVSDGALIDERVCDCCSTDAVLVGPGALLAAFRDRSDGDVRDISTSRLVSGGWSPSRGLHDDGWRISACPVNGPALAAAGDRVACAWFTAPDQRGRVQVAFSSDGGATFGEPVRVDGGEPAGRVDVGLLDDGTAVVSWLEKGAIRLRWVDGSGPRSEPLTVAVTSDSRASGFPRLAPHDERIFLAWTQPGADGRPSRVRTAFLPAAR